MSGDFGLFSWLVSSTAWVIQISMAGALLASYLDPLMGGERALVHTSTVRACATFTECSRGWDLGMRLYFRLELDVCYLEQSKYAVKGVAAALQQHRATAN